MFKERKVGTAPWDWFNQEGAQAWIFHFSPCVFHLSAIIVPGLCVLVSVPCVCALTVTIALCVPMPAWCLSVPNKRLWSVFISQHHMRKGCGTLYRNLEHFCRELSYLLQLTLKHSILQACLYQYLHAASNIYCRYLLYNVAFDLFAVFNKWLS